MATGRSYSLKDLKSALKTRMAEFEMLNNTLIEAIERGSSEASIDAIKRGIKDAEENIKVLNDWIEEKVNEEEKKDVKVEYSFYNEIKKPTLPKSVKFKKLSTIKKELDKLEDELKDINKTRSLYDSIEKVKSDEKSKKLDETVKVSLSDYKPYDTPYNHLKYEDIYKETCSSKLPLINPYENVINSNRFLVRFGTPLEIPEYYVRGVDFLYNNKELVITVFNFIKEDKHPIIAELLTRKFNRDMTCEFPVSIDYLDPTGVTLYTERYHHCHLVNVERDSVDYTRDDLNRILLTVSYSDVTYETSH